MPRAIARDMAQLLHATRIYRGTALELRLGIGLAFELGRERRIMGPPMIMPYGRFSRQCRGSFHGMLWFQETHDNGMEAHGAAMVTAMKAHGSS